MVDPERRAHRVCAVNEERAHPAKARSRLPSTRAIETCPWRRSPGDITEVAATTTDPAKTLTRALPELEGAVLPDPPAQSAPGRGLEPLKRGVQVPFHDVAAERGVSAALSAPRGSPVELATCRSRRRRRVSWVAHHLAHAASAAFTSGLRRCARGDASTASAMGCRGACRRLARPGKLTPLTAHPGARLARDFLRARHPAHEHA